jgi:hypothetical protein
MTLRRSVRVHTHEYDINNACTLWNICWLTGLLGMYFIVGVHVFVMTSYDDMSVKVTLYPVSVFGTTSYDDICQYRSRYILFMYLLWQAKMTCQYRSLCVLFMYLLRQDTMTYVSTGHTVSSSCICYDQLQWHMSVHVSCILSTDWHRQCVCLHSNRLPGIHTGPGVPLLLLWQPSHRGGKVYLYDVIKNLIAS